jgi:hypothetical protein
MKKMEKKKHCITTTTVEDDVKMANEDWKSENKVKIPFFNFWLHIENPSMYTNPPLKKFLPFGD